MNGDRAARLLRIARERRAQVEVELGRLDEQIGRLESATEGAVLDPRAQEELEVLAMWPGGLVDAGAAPKPVAGPVFFDPDAYLMAEIAKEKAR